MEYRGTNSSMSQLAKVLTRASKGLDAPIVTIEVHISGGLPNFSIVGLPETTVKESKDRVRSSIMNSKFKFPNQRITVSLAPADLPKSGGRYDLPIAIGLLLASKQLKAQVNMEEFEFFGELGLDGLLRPTFGLLPAIIQAHKIKHSIIIPFGNIELSALLEDAKVYVCKHLLEVCELIKGRAVLIKHKLASDDIGIYSKDFSQVKGQYHAKRALEIAAAGGHNVLFIGPPGSGKTMLSERMPSIMPPLTTEKMLERASIYSVANKYLALKDFKIRPFRAPHHSSSAVALVGGGSYPKPGEISLAHEGVLFLDEIPEFPRGVLEALRQPLESGVVHLSRAAQQTTFPANFQLIGAMNPCPCGYANDGSNKCHCTEDQISKYYNKISGPLLDRIDMILEVPPLPKEIILNTSHIKVENSSYIRARVFKAYNAQVQRQGKLNAVLEPDEVDKLIKLNRENKIFLENIFDKLQFSARAYHKVLKVAQTIADLNCSRFVDKNNLIEAVGYKRYHNN